MPKIHFLHPVIGHACGMARPHSELTTDINQVTCKSCLSTVTGKNRGGRPPKPEGRNKVQIVLTDRALARLRQIKEGDRSQWISNLIINS